MAFVAVNGWRRGVQPPSHVNYEWLELVLNAFSIVAIATLLADTATAQALAPAEIIFFVYTESPKRGATDPRPNVEVLRVGATGLERIGTTNARGEVTLKTSDVFKKPSIVVLFCDPRSKEHCAAVRLDTDLLAGFAEFSVELPPIKIIDRSRVQPRK